MKSNVGNIDKILRIVLGVVIIVLGFVLHTWWGLVGVVLIATGFLNWCPIYAVLGLSTKPKADAQK
jgi:hypothetical protein